MSVYDYEPRETGEPDSFEPRFPSPPQPTPRPSVFRRPVTWRTALVIVFAIVVVRVWLIESAIVDGISMAPTLLPDEWVLVVKPLKPDRFSVVVFTDPQEGVPAVKRVVGLPGDEVGSVPLGLRRRGYLPQSRLAVNGIVYNEPYAPSTVGSIHGGRMPEDGYFVLGDNRDDSVDSRFYGAVRRKHIGGVAVAVVYPLSRMRIISSAAEPIPDQSTGAAH